MLRMYSLRMSDSIRINGPCVNIEVIVREISKNRKDRTGQIEVLGSPFIAEGSYIWVSKHKEIALAPGISVKVADRTSSNNYLRLYFENISPGYAIK